MVVAFLFGGLLKGATGVGAPFLAIPVMAILVDVPFAVAVFLIPNIVSNALQTWRFRGNTPTRKLTHTFAFAGIVGAGIGTVALAKFSSSVLTTSVALVVLAFVAFRLFNPHWSLSMTHAVRAAGPVGGIGGFFQGAIGLSGPISITFMNAVGLERASFIYTMSLYFLAMTMIQLPIQIMLNVLTIERLIYGLIAFLPMSIGMYFGDFLGKKISAKVFNRIILVILTLLAFRLLIENFL